MTGTEHAWSCGTFAQKRTEQDCGYKVKRVCSEQHEELVSADTNTELFSGGASTNTELLRGGTSTNTELLRGGTSTNKELLSGGTSTNTALFSGGAS
jgi:hypothetical protein